MPQGGKCNRVLAGWVRTAVYRIGLVLGGFAVLAVCLVARNVYFDRAASAQGRSSDVLPAGSVLHAPAASSARTAAAAPASTAQSGSPLRRPTALTAPANAAATATPKLAAMVNGQDITREQLAQECLFHYGEQVLESLVNRRLIEQECRRQGITISHAEVSAEIERIAKTFSITVDQLLQMLEQERGIKRQQYAEELIWPMLALRKLAGSRLEVSEEELRREYESRYGPAVKARMIVCDDRQKAERIRAEAAADPERFGQLARQHSVDSSSAALDGQLPQPIRRHRGPQALEQAAFAMADGEISPLIPVGNQYVILKRESLLPASTVRFEQAKMRLLEMVRDEKMREVGSGVFRELQDRAEVVNVWNDAVRRQQLPGVAALVNGEQITLRELAQACFDRHAAEVLEGMINRTLLEQACRKQKIEVSEEDLNREIMRAAAAMLPRKPDDSPDVEKWVAMYTQENGISEAVYRRDVVWPTVALKKLVGNRVQISEDDLQKGYEANYGPRVRCLAIVLDDLRHAQKVWAMARGNPTREFFAELAATYSVDPGSRALGGEVKPIQKHGGQPLLEKEAFALAPGDLSGIIDVGGGQYVILFCEGHTKPVEVDFASVRQIIYDDLHEKKLRIEMGKYFDALQAAATIDNYLAGTSQSPARRDEPGRVIPAQAIRPVDTPR